MKLSSEHSEQESVNHKIMLFGFKITTWHQQFGLKMINTCTVQ